MSQSTGGRDRPAAERAERLALSADLEVVLTADGPGWSVAACRGDGTPCQAGDGAAEALLALLRQEGDLADRWQVLRLGPIPDVAGERPVTVDQTNLSVVVGDRVNVKWLRQVRDDPQPSLAALAQLSAVGFAQMPTPYAVLTWTSPTGRALPVAYVSEQLRGAEDGWSWCVELVRSLARGRVTDPWAADLPRRLGRLAADLHVALATPSHVFPRPVQPAGASRVQRWHDGAYAMLEAALQIPDPTTSAVVSRCAGAMTTAFDEMLADEEAVARTPVQHIHGDLHVGQVLRYEEALAIVDFDGNPVAPAAGGVMHPAARDVAQLVRSLDHVGRVVLHRSPELPTAPVRDWLGRCREELLTAYRQSLQERAMPYLLDERLLVPFELEQELRELVYAERHLPGWAYAPLASLGDLFPPLGGGLPEQR